MTTLETRINGIVVEPSAGETILSAAERAGISIPTLCFAKGMLPEGGCRLCLVQTAPSKLQAACHTPITAGMDIQTETQELKELRRDILSLYLSSHLQETFDRMPASAEIRKLAEELGADRRQYSGPPVFDYKDTSHPYLRFQTALCINCRKCMHACEEIQGQFVFGIEGRGGHSHLVYGPAREWNKSPCVACGACVSQCPTGAITDIDRMNEIPATQHVISTCGYCGVGCQLDIETDGKKVLRISAPPHAAVNHGHLCVKGRYAHTYQQSVDRLTTPLLRVNGKLEPVGWAEAIEWLARRLKEIRDQCGPDALGTMTSSRSTNEAAYLLQKLFRTEIGTNNVDCCARVCHASSAMALQLVTGTGAASASYEDIEKARLIFLAGSNATEAHPVVGARIKQAALRGAKLIVADPRAIELSQYADVFLQLKPGTNVPLFNGIAKILMETNGINFDYVDERTEGAAEFFSFLEKLSLKEVEKVTGVSEPQLREAARLIVKSSTGLFTWGLGLSELTQGVSSVISFCNLAMLTGSIGMPGAGVLPLRGQNNVQGNADMGGMPNQITGYQPWTDPEVQDRCVKYWGKAPPTTPGLTISEMIDAAAQKKIKALWIQGEDIAQSDPHQSHVIEALTSLELLVVQEIFLSETAKLAHLVFPAAGALEQLGTFTNGERRIQLVRPAVPAPEGARPDWEVIYDVAVAMGARWAYTGPSQVMDEIANIAPKLFGGVHYDRLDPDGIQWPCPERSHPGSKAVHQERFLRGKGHLMGIDYIPSPEMKVHGYPYVLITGRVLEHYNVGTMTRRTPNAELVPYDALEIHPEDAGREKIDEGAFVALESQWGKAKARAHLTERVPQGTFFLSFHYPETHANLLVGPHVDPQSKCPEYKITAVRISEPRR